MKILVDAMGGDFAPVEIVKGVVESVLADNVEVVLVGQQSVMEQELSKYKGWESRIHLVNATQVIECSESPTEGVKNKPDSSIVVGMNLLKKGEGAAFVSAGHSGAMVCAALLMLGRLEGVERPALACRFPSAKGQVLLIDAGANADCRPSFLVQFAQMGSLYMKSILGVDNPRVGLLSSGEEDTKGNKLVKETHPLLRALDLNFVGNVEGKDVPRGMVDVVVTDGFTGNVALKASEGIGEAIYASLREAVKASPIPGIANLMTSPALTRWVDYSEYGGAPLVGVNGNVIVSHGRSSAKAIRTAILLGKRSVEGRFVEIMREHPLQPVGDNHNNHENGVNNVNVRSGGN